MTIHTTCTNCDGYGAQCDGVSKFLHCDGTGYTTAGETIVPLEDSRSQCECPACGGKAVREEWERIEGGSYNCYYRITCDDCGHTEHNDIFN